MKLIIAGSRDIESKDIVVEALNESPFDVDEISVLLCGMADGVDSIAYKMFQDVEDISIREFPADDFFDEAAHPKQAPLLRNSKMIEEGDGLLAVWDGSSTGTEDVIEKAREDNLSLFIHRTDTETLDSF